MARKKTMRYRVAFVLGYAQAMVWYGTLTMTNAIYRLAVSIDLVGASWGADRGCGGSDEDEDDGQPQ